MSSLYFASVVAILSPLNAIYATTLYLEDFEDGNVDYTLTAPAGRVIIEASDGEFDYFGRIASNGLSVSSDLNIAGATGDGYFGGNDFDATSTGDPGITEDSAVFTVFGIDITGQNGLLFSGSFAEDTANNNPNWDSDTAIIVDVRIDGGSFNTIFAIQSESLNGTNSAARIDTNFDGVGDGALITNILTSYSAPISGSGSTLDLRISLNEFDANGEDFAFDNLSITSVPEPSTTLLIGLAAIGMIQRRRR